jgi:N-acetylglucosamine-6-sulfatase
MKSLRFKVLSMLVLTSLIISSCGALGAEPKAVVLPMENRPNILFILTDDLDSRLNTMDYMQNVQDLLVSHGTSLENYFVTSPVCCPSRATTLRGQYTHNHAVYNNYAPDGGFEKFNETKEEDSTLAVWLQSAGYRTALMGKYLNNYPYTDNRVYVPPGWSEWYSPAKKNAYDGYDYTLNENGVLVSYSPAEKNYFTDVLSRKAVDFIVRANKDDTPFFLYLAPFAPHEPATPSYRHSELFSDVTVLRSPSFNEADISDKGPGLNGNPLLTDAQILEMDNLYRNRIRSLQAVDEMVAELIKTLDETGQLENTYIIFTSDNGFHMGQHRLYSGKEFLFEEDISVPFVVRGPGIPENVAVSEYLTGNVDLASTLTEWAGVQPPAFVDGRSLADLLGGSPIEPENWRTVYLLEEYRSGDKNFPTPTYSGLRTSQYLYVEYSEDFVEFYDLQKDPYQLENIAPTTDPSVLKYYSDSLKALNQCSGDTCRELEAGFTPVP